MTAKMGFHFRSGRGRALNVRQWTGLRAKALVELRLALCLLLAVFLLDSAGSTQAAAPLQPQSNSTNFDGPAELPRVYIKSALANTPAPGKTLLIKSSDNLQKALDEAVCGDTLKLEAGASFVGHFWLPKKACDDSHWIVIRSSAPDDTLPPEGTRMSPCYAGIASLPGRPTYHCASAKNLMVAIISPAATQSGPLTFLDGANHYRFIGIEITREASPASVVALAGPDLAAAADHIIFDRVWMHGTARDETRRGLFLSGTTYMAVVDSYFSDFHCIAREGSCTDSQAIAGGSGDLPMGPFKIVNNFLEAAGENIIFGGDRATMTPADIEVRHNYLFKPLTWLKGQPDFVGGPKGNPFIVKNLFELKNAQRVLFEGNILQNSWGGFTQTGFAILLTPRNQSNGPLRSNLCPLCRVTDVTIRDCFIAHVGNGLDIANAPNPKDAPAAAAGERYSIHDLVIDDIDGRKYSGFGAFLVLISREPTLKDVRIDHVTALFPRVFMNAGIMNAHIHNFAFTNNLIGAGEKEITSTGGGPENCVFQPERQQPAGILKNCFDSITFTNNAIVGGLGGWPPGNFTPKNLDAVGLVNDRSGLGAFRLCPDKVAACKGPSKYLGAGSDHKNIGADIDAVVSATQGVME
jgi:hypothetical protein